MRVSPKALLPNGQAFSLDPAADKPLESQRNAWIKAQYAGGGKKPQAPNAR